MQVLLTKDQIGDARRVMHKRGISAIDTPLRHLMRALRLVNGVSVGDHQKSWDVLSTVEFIEKNVGKSEAIADLGCYASEVLISLHKLGYTNLTGIDLNPKLSEMPYRESIRYEVCNFMETAFPAETFKVITSISVIEHGYAPQSLLAEASRLLQPGGFFIASFDYWPNKIDTTGTTFFGMDWLIFSRKDVEQFIELASGFGFQPTGELQFLGKERTISCAGKDYTFATLMMRKSV